MTDIAQRLAEALEALREAVKLLYEQAEGCAMNHYGNDFYEFGEPPYFSDCRKAMDKTDNALAAYRAQPQPVVGEEVQTVIDRLNEWHLLDGREGPLTPAGFVSHNKALTSAAALIERLNGEKERLQAQLDAQDEFIEKQDNSLEKGFVRGLEEAAKIADTGMLVPPDGGSPTEDECCVARNIAASIRALKDCTP